MVAAPAGAKVVASDFYRGKVKSIYEREPLFRDFAEVRSQSASMEVKALEASLLVNVGWTVEFVVQWYMGTCRVQFKLGIPITQIMRENCSFIC